MAHRIVRDFDRPAPEVMERLKDSFPVLYAGPMTLGKDVALDPSIKPMRRDMKLMGPALTVQLDEVDHLMPMYAITLAKPGDILVIATGGELQVGVWGAMMTISAWNKKVGGVVTDGAILDGASLLETRMPMFSRGLTPVWSTWEKGGSINVPVELCGHIVEPGDLVVGDTDGVVVIPKGRIGEAIERVEAFNAYRLKIDWSERIRKERNTWFEILELQDAVARLNIPESDR